MDGSWTLEDSEQGLVRLPLAWLLLFAQEIVLQYELLLSGCGSTGTESKENFDEESRRMKYHDYERP